MGMFDFITNPINDAFHAVVDSNPVTSGISNAIHNVGEKTGINDVVDKVAPYAAAAAAIYLSGGALAPEAMASLDAGAAASGLTTEEYATLVANSAPVDSAMASTMPTTMESLSSAYNALPSVAQGAVKGAGLNIGYDVLTGKPITPQGVLTSAGAGALGTGVADLTGSNTLGGLASIVGGAKIGQALSPTQTASTTTTDNTGSTTGALDNTSLMPSTSNLVGGSVKGALPSYLQSGNFASAPVTKPINLMQKLKQLNPQLFKQYPQLEQADPNFLNMVIGDRGSQDTVNAKDGGVIHLKRGGSPLTSLSEGSNNEHIPEFITGATGHYVKGKGDGQSDDIPAMLADGEYVFDADTVAQLGNGSSDAGAKLLDHFREALREHKRSAPSDKIPPQASPLAYMKEALKRHKG